MTKRPSDNPSHTNDTDPPHPPTLGTSITPDQDTPHESDTQIDLTDYTPSAKFGEHHAQPESLRISSEAITDNDLTVEYNNIGGITQATHTIPPGVTLLVGENATNRTSMLEGLGAALGGQTGSLTAGADTGHVTLTAGDTSFTVEFERTATGVQRHYDAPWDVTSEHRAAVDNFVVLHESNPIRSAVRTGDALYELLMDPVDTAALETQISKLESYRQELRSQIQEIERTRDRLPELEERRNTLQDKIAEIEQELDAVNDKIESYEMDRSTAEEQTELMDEYERLLDRQEQLKNQLDRQRDTLEETQTLLDEKRDELEAFSVEVPDDYQTPEELSLELDHIQQEISDLESIERRIRELVSATDEMLSASDRLQNEFATSDVTSRLDPGAEQLECWTCGSVVEQGAIQERKEELQSLAKEKRAEITDLKDRQKELQRMKSDIEAQHEQKTELESEIAQLEREVHRVEEDVSEMEGQLADVEQEVADVEADLEEQEADDESAFTALLEAYQSRGELQSELERLQDELASVEGEISELEGVTESSDELKDREQEVKERLEMFRGMIGRIETEVVDEFNSKMESILELLGYENLERVWIERKQGEGARATTTSMDPEGSFELHVVRETPGGAVTEDTVSNLSESEREVVGLVVAVAGFVVHAVGRVIPVMLLDSVEAIDASRLDALIEWIQEETSTSHLVAALLEEDAAVLSESYHRIRPAESPGAPV